MTGIMNPAVTHRTEGRHRLKCEDHKRIKIKRKEENKNQLLKGTYTYIMHYKKKV
jgi:hypothetical protein